MMHKGTIKDISKVVVSNVVSLLSGILISFLLPKVMSVPDYGYYKTFTLYISYVGLLHFGLCDGIYLKYGGEDFSDLDPLQFRTYFRTLTILETGISAVLILSAIFFIPEELRFIFICLGIYSLFHIYGSYYQLISQATSRFHEYSVRTIIYSLLRIAGVVAIWIYSWIESSLVSYKLYIYITLAIEILLDVWYFRTYRIITFGRAGSIRENRGEIKELFRLGFPLLVTNLTSTFLLSLDRQFVNVLFPKEDYAIYAFAYNMLALVTTTTSAIATILFPKLKRASEAELKGNYSVLVSGILLVVFTGMAVYFPLCLFIRWFLPHYTDSLVVFRVIFPGLATSSAISIVMYNYFKVTGNTKTYLKICILILIVSGLANYAAYAIFHTMISISAASIAVMILWYVLSERYFIQHYKVQWKSNFCFMLIMMGIFYGITCLDNAYIGFVCYCSVFALAVFLLKKRDVSRIKSMVAG